MRRMKRFALAEQSALDRRRGLRRLPWREKGTRAFCRQSPQSKRL
jgi:hypothetical protein